LIHNSPTQLHNVYSVSHFHTYSLCAYTPTQKEPGVQMLDVHDGKAVECIFL